MKRLIRYFASVPVMSVLLTGGCLWENTGWAMQDVASQPSDSMPGLSLQPIASARTPQQDWEDEFAYLERHIELIEKDHFNLERLNREAKHVSSVYQRTDQSPCDIVFRNTCALANYLLKTQPEDQEIQLLKSRLDGWAKQYRDSPPQNRTENWEHFQKLCSIRRSLSFSNKLLKDLDEIVFLTRYCQRQGQGEIHIVDQYFGFNAKPGGSLMVLRNPFSEKPMAQPLMLDTPVANGRQKGKPLTNGSFLSLELNYDADALYFAWTQAVHTPVSEKNDWSHNFGTYEELERRIRTAPPGQYDHYFWAPDRVYHIYRYDLKNGLLTQLTDGHVNTIDPCELPNGRIVYISDEQGANQRCGARWIGAGVLHSMNPDGSSSIPLSFHETNEWQPSVTNDGMIVYSRWDYVDRDDDGAHHMWTCYPDGRDPRAPHGNYPVKREIRPWAELSFRAIPNSNKFIAVAVPHHGIAYGSLILVDPSVPDDGAMSQVKRLTPEVQFPEAEEKPGYPYKWGKGDKNALGERFGTPWPLSEDFYLCVYDRDGHDYGLYLVDSFGNRELLWQDEKVPCLDPIPLRPRPRPRIIPDMTQPQLVKDSSKPQMAEVFVSNVYETERPLPPNTKIKWLRVVNIFPKSNVHQNEPNIGIGNQSLTRGSLGLVPVEEDGSVWFSMPANTNVYFQLLDENKQAVHSMRSSTYAHVGERLSCMGCHEDRFRAPRQYNLSPSPMALSRAPSQLQPEPSGSYPLTFPRLVQPVLDKNCVQCHVQNAPKAPLLDGRTFQMVDKNKDGQKDKHPNRYGWSNGFRTLSKMAWTRHGGNGIYWDANKTSYSVPGDVGARASRLLPFLRKGHHGVQLTNEEWQRLTLWIDLNSNFYGDYQNAPDQAVGKLVKPKFGLPSFAERYLR